MAERAIPARSPAPAAMVAMPSVLTPRRVRVVAEVPPPAPRVAVQVGTAGVQVVPVLMVVRAVTVGTARRNWWRRVVRAVKARQACWLHGGTGGAGGYGYGGDGGAGGTGGDAVSSLQCGFTAARGLAATAPLKVRAAPADTRTI